MLIQKNQLDQISTISGYGKVLETTEKSKTEMIEKKILINIFQNLFQDTT